jgi:DegV family protein with EDD domain
MNTSPEAAADGARSRVAVVTDSTTYLPPDLIERWRIERVSLYVGWDGDHHPEPEYDLERFYARLRESEDLPSTSQPSVGDFLARYEPLAEAGRDVVSIHIAAGLSGTCESAREAARLITDRGLGGRIEVVDGQTGAGGLGCLVLAAAEAAERGERLEQVVEAARRTRAELDMWFCLDTLEYLRRGGRIGAAQALVGSALKIKPILTFGTEIAPVGRVRTRKRAMERMVSYLHELRRRDASAWFVQHAQSPLEAASLVAAGTEILGVDPLFCTEVGPVLGAHLGSGMLVGGTGCAPAERS